MEERPLVRCYLCKDYFKRITQSHLNFKHDRITIAQYLDSKGAVLEIEHSILVPCSVCGISVSKKKPRSINLCKNCYRVKRLEKKRDQRSKTESLSAVKNKARFRGTLSEDEQGLLGQTGFRQEGDLGIDSTHYKWDFIPGRRGSGKTALGMEDIGCVSDDDLSIVQVWDHKTEQFNERIKGALILEQQRHRIRSIKISK